MDFLGDFGQRLLQCTGVVSKPKAKAPAWMSTVANVGAVSLTTASLIYSVVEYGPLPAALIGSCVMGGLWWAGWSLARCKIEGRPPLLCMGLGLKGTLRSVQTGLLGFSLPDPDSILNEVGNGILGAAGCGKRK